MENYIRFVKQFLSFSEGEKLGLTESYGNSAESFQENIRYSINHCKIFKVGEDVKKLLFLTKPPVKNNHINLPFPEMFIDVSFSKEELNKIGLDMGYGRIIGIMLKKGNMIHEKLGGDVVGEALRITIFSETGGKWWFDTFNKNINLTEGWNDWNVTVKENETTDKKAKKIVHCFALNFLNFMNNPEIQTVVVERDDEKNEKRISKGKIPLPSIHHVRVTGVLKEYLNKLNSEGSFELSHRFWVRGHFRTLKSEERYGKNAGKRSWILPYIKGKGILVEKQYDVVKKPKGI
jgi:hypothetical protein|tara:strand:+ start:5508 stop:6380 length:873 start_codon:yes stop_codon:yes gene_type:complete